MGEARPPEDRDAAQEIARDLANLAAQFGTLKGEAMNWLTEPKYGPPLRQHIESAHASVEARRSRVRLDEGR